MDTPSVSFVSAKTPQHNGPDHRFESNAATRTTDVGLSTHIDVLETAPQIEFQLLTNKLLFYALTTLLFYGVFTIVAYVGISVETVYETIGTSKKAEHRVEMYNTYSGYVMSLVEAIVHMHMEKFLPVLDVYVHNALYFMTKPSATNVDDSGTFKPSGRISRWTHHAIVCSFPLVLALTMGNSLRGLQAAQSSDGFKRVMIAQDLTKEQPTLERIKASIVAKPSVTSSRSHGWKAQDTILKNAIRGKSTPFSFDTKSPCGISSASYDAPDEETAELVEEILNSNKNGRTFQLNVHDLDTTSAVYGFLPREWNSEAFADALEPTTAFRFTYNDVVTAMKMNQTIAKPPSIELDVAFEMLVQGKLVVERAQGNAATDTYACSMTDGRTQDDVVPNTTTTANTTTSRNTSTENIATNTEVVVPKKLALGLFRRRRLQTDERVKDDDDDGLGDTTEVDDSRNQWTRNAHGVRQCQGAVSSLFDMFDFYKSELHTIENLMQATVFIFNKTLANLSIEETTITLEKYTLTEQIHLESIEIDVPINATTDYGLLTGCTDAEIQQGCKPIYTYLSGLSESFCGSDGCAFLDASNSMKMQREIGIVPYVTNCTINYQSVHYSADFRGYFPDNCTKVSNAAFLYGIGSYITGDEYGKNDTTHNTSAPYIIAPRRHIRFSFAKVTWQTEDLAKKFNAKCRNGKGNADCNGLWYQLKPSNRFLFAGLDALPTKKLATVDFRSPISLVQLNSPTLYVDKLQSRITLEPLDPTNFKRVKWDKTDVIVKATNGSNVTTYAGLFAGQCSIMIDSYLRQVSDNNYAIEQPLQVMYTSFFYYLMQNAAVTEINDTKLALNGTSKLNQTTVLLSKLGDKLGNVKLKGDMQIRSIKVSIPKDSFKTSLAGCILIFVIMVLVICIPARRVEYFDDDTSVACEYLKIKNDEAYPNSVHKKTLLFPTTNETVAFEEIAIERMVLVHQNERQKKIVL